MDGREVQVRTETAARCISVRELGRSTGLLIDEVERDGKSFVISRYGRMVALVVPLPDRLVFEFSDGIEGLAECPGEEIDLEELNLNELEREIVKDAATVPFWSPEDRPDFTRDVVALATSLGRLELKGLIERTRGGRRATQTARRVAELLR